MQGLLLEGTELNSFVYVILDTAGVSGRIKAPKQSRSVVFLVRYTRRFSSCMLRASPRISLVSTSKLAGVPASSVFSPLTIDS